MPNQEQNEADKQAKKWEDYDIIRDTVSLLTIPTFILAISYYFSSYLGRLIIFISSIIIFLIISKYKLKFDLRIMLAAEKYGSQNNIKPLKTLFKDYSREEKYRIHLKFTIISAWIFTAITIGIPLLASISLSPLTNLNIHSDLISLDSILLVAASIFTALMNQFIAKFSINKLLSSLSPFTYCLVTSLISIMMLIFGETGLSFVFTTLSIFMLYTLMGSFLFYLKVSNSLPEPLEN